MNQKQFVVCALYGFSVCLVGMAYQHQVTEHFVIVATGFLFLLNLWCQRSEAVVFLLMGAMTFAKAEHGFQLNHDVGTLWWGVLFFVNPCTEIYRFIKRLP